jgi:hypothetical protein
MAAVAGMWWLWRPGCGGYGGRDVVVVAAAMAMAMEAVVAATPLWPPFKGASGRPSSGRHECLRAAAQSARHAGVDAAAGIEGEGGAPEAHAL